MIVKLFNGCFIGVQIKTRSLSQPEFKACDNQIIGTFARFCNIDSKFPGPFCKFELVTNHGFWSRNETANNLPHILDQLKIRRSVKGLRKTNPIKNFVGKICEKSSLSEDSVISTLLKCSLTSKEDSIRSVERDVVDALVECPDMSDKTFSILQLIAAKVVDFAAKASSKTMSGSIFDLYDPSKDFHQVLTDQQLAGKRIQKKDVEDIIHEAISAEVSFEMLCVEEGIQLPDLPKGLELMFEKLDRGKLQAPRIREVENLVRSFEALYMRWAARYGTQIANQRWEHLLAVARFDCTEARVAVEVNDEPFGAAMYDELKELLKRRCDADPDRVYKCTPEHLIGAAGIVTQKCKAWWSKEFKPVKMLR